MRNFSKNLMVVFSAILFLFSSYETAEARRFWGKEREVIMRGETLDGTCREVAVERKYIFWIKVKEKTVESSCE